MPCESLKVTKSNLNSLLDDALREKRKQLLAADSTGLKNRRKKKGSTAVLYSCLAFSLFPPLLQSSTRHAVKSFTQTWAQWAWLLFTPLHPRGAGWGQLVILLSYQKRPWEEVSFKWLRPWSGYCTGGKFKLKSGWEKFLHNGDLSDISIISEATGLLLETRFKSLPSTTSPKCCFSVAPMRWDQVMMECIWSSNSTGMMPLSPSGGVMGHDGSNRGTQIHVCVSVYPNRNGQIVLKCLLTWLHIIKSFSPPQS